MDVGAVVTPRPSLRVPALIVGLVLVITGIGVVAALLNPGMSAAPGPTVTVSGSGAMSSGPIMLSGDYSFRWWARPPTGASCFHALDLRTIGGKPVTGLISSRTIDGEATGHGSFYDFEPGRYFIQSEGGCDWTFSLQPQ